MGRDDWKRLASHVRQRRVALGYRVRRDFAREVDLTDRTLGTLESGQRVGLDTLASIELGLGWRPGSAEEVLAGGEPSLTEPETDRPTGLNERERALWDAMVAGGYPDGERRGVIAYLRSRSEINVS